MCIRDSDYSETVIATMMKRRGGRKTLQYMVMDATKMSFDDASFDVVIDKAESVQLCSCVGVSRCHLRRRQ